MTETSRRIIMYFNQDMQPEEVERWAACYGYIVTNPLKNGEHVKLIHPDGTTFKTPPGTQIWVSDLIASEHDQESA